MFSDASVDPNEVLNKAGDIMRTRYSIDECTVQLETYTDEMEDCTRCQEPCDWGPSLYKSFTSPLQVMLTITPKIFSKNML